MRATERTTDHGGGRGRRRAAGVLVAAVVAATSIGLAPQAQATLFEPGDITLTLVGGAIKLNTGTTAPNVEPFEVDLAGDPENPGAPITFTGTITDAGVLTIPKAGVNFPPTTIQEGPLTVQVAISAVNDVVGSIDPTTGAATAPLTLAVQLDVLGSLCTLTVPLDLSSSKTGGAPLAGGQLKLADTGFSVPATTKVGALCDLVDNLLGLPAPRTGGVNSTVLTFTTDDVEGPPPTSSTTEAPTTTAAPATTTPAPSSPVVPATEWYLPAGSIEPTYTCAGADDATAGLLGVLGGDDLSLAPTLSMASIAPSPAKGATFEPQFGLRLDLDPTLVAGVIALGISEASVSGMELQILPHAGVEGAPLVAKPPDQTIQLVAGQAASLIAGPFSAPFTRTSEIGEPVAFAAGPVKMTLSVSLGGSPVSLNLACAPSGDTVLSVTDQQGTPPAPAPASAPAPTGGVGAGGGESGGASGGPPGAEVAEVGQTRDGLPRTGSTNLELTLFACVLFGLGIAAANEAVVRRGRVLRRSPRP
jgi:hypothetical protein